MRKMTLRKQHLAKEIAHLVKSEKRIRSFRIKIKKYHPYDISEAFRYLDEIERKIIYVHLNHSELALVFEHFDEDKAAVYLAELDVEDAISILEKMERDDAAHILQEMDEDEQILYLNEMSPEARQKIRRLQTYKKDTAGAFMNTDFIEFKAEWDVKEAMRKLIGLADEIEMIETLFVVNDARRLIGTLELKELIVAKHPKTIGEVMDEKFQAVYVDDDIEDVIRDIKNYDTFAMPVIDSEGKIQGIITMDDALDILDEESHDDYAKLGAVSVEHDIDETALRSARRRMPWLVALLFLNLIVSTVLSNFEDTIGQVIALVLFQPLILGMAGNIGTQSLAVTVLGISRKTLSTQKTIITHLLKEIGVGAINGALLGLISFILTYVFLNIAPVGDKDPQIIASVVGLSLFMALTISSLLGAIIPLGLNRVNVDPAIASGPFITTLNDIVALTIYFSLATILILTL